MPLPKKPGGAAPAGGAKTGKSGLVAKLGDKLRKAHEAHKTDETQMDTGGSLPGGIEGGIAKLVDCKFDTYKKGDNQGQYYFYAAGVVVAPKDHDGVPIEGLRTSIMEPLCDTPNKTRATVEDHLAWILNEMRKLGIDTADIGFDQLEETAEALKLAQPTFRFRTWKGKKKVKGEAGYNEKYDGPNAPGPRVNEVWSGAVNFEQDETDTVEDSTTDAVEEAPAPTPPKAGPKAKGGPKKAAPDLSEMTLEELAELAGKEPAEPLTGEAQKLLLEKAVEAGHDKDAAEGAESWDAVIELINNPPAAEEAEAAEEAAAEEVEWVPAKEDIYLYKPVDPKTKKPAAKGVEVEVSAVDEKAQRVDLIKLDNRKITYKGVAWDKLEAAS